MAVSKANEYAEALSRDARPVPQGAECLRSNAQIQFQRMELSNVEEIMRIEKASYKYPWSARFFFQELSVPCSRSMLAIRDGRPVGYVIFWVLATEIDIHNLAVDPDCRRQGVGRALLREVIGAARAIGLSRVTLEVRKSNEAAQNLYRSLGFAVHGVRRGYYSDDGEDALAMTLEMQPPGATT